MRVGEDMRVTFVNQFYKPDISPTARLAASLAEHRALLGDQVTVVTSRGGYVQRGDAKEKAGNPVVHRVWTPQLGKVTVVRRLIDWLTFYMLAVARVATLPQQDVIVSLTTPPFIAWAAVLHKLFHWRTRVVLWNMDCYPDVLERTGLIHQGGLLSWMMRVVNRMMFRHVDGIVCLDAAMAELLVSQYRPRGRDLPAYVIPNWEQADEFPRDGLLAHHFNERFVVLYMGNAGYGHEFETALSVADALRDEPFEFRFVGGGARRPFILHQSQNLHLKNVVLQEYVPEAEKRAMLSLADCALITLQDFALGVMSPSKLHANLAMGVPVLYIGPAGGNVDEAIRRYDCGGSFRKSDVAGVTQFLQDLRAMRSDARNCETMPAGRLTRPIATRKHFPFLITY